MKQTIYKLFQNTEVRGLFPNSFYEPTVTQMSSPKILQGKKPYRLRTLLNNRHNALTKFLQVEPKNIQSGIFQECRAYS